MDLGSCIGWTIGKKKKIKTKRTIRGQEFSNVNEVREATQKNLRKQRSAYICIHPKAEWWNWEKRTLNCDVEVMRFFCSIWYLLCLSPFSRHLLICCNYRTTDITLWPSLVQRLKRKETILRSRFVIMSLSCSFWHALCASTIKSIVIVEKQTLLFNLSSSLRFKRKMTMLTNRFGILRFLLFILVCFGCCYY